MKKAMLIISAALSSIILIASHKSEQKTKVPEAKKPTEIKATKASEQKPVLFIIKEYKGKIAAFKEGQDEPFKTVDGAVLKTLPKADREILKEGIPIHSIEELMQLIEDYDS